MGGSVGRQQPSICSPGVHVGWLPPDVCAQALTHTLEGAVGSAYRRGDRFEKRRNLMSYWAQYLGSTHDIALDN